MFIVFEGMDGSGKSTQVELLAESLREQGRAVVTVREPGGTPIGEAVRELLLSGVEMTALTEAILFNAARAELVDTVIAPALEAGAIVIADRYADSTVVYQGIARGLGIAQVYAINMTSTGGLGADKTFVLLLSPEEAKARRTGEDDRFERDDAFMKAVEYGYEMLAVSIAKRYVGIKATDSVEEIAREIRDQIRRHELEVKKFREAESRAILDMPVEGFPEPGFPT